MGRTDQPYMYNAPANRLSTSQDALYGFNPKAVTQASRSPPKKLPPKQQDGPLVNFNRHPDSYLILPYGRTNAQPMNPRIVTHIKWARYVQMAFRVLQLLGAIGLLICVICVNGTQDTEGWILRIPAAVDLLACSYAIYHLMRPSKGRTPASSAGYHFFALFVDLGLLPFYVFTAMMAESNWQEAPGTEGRWKSFFSSDVATTKILLATWLFAVTDGGLHLFTLALDLYLIVVFRKIARLPPDLNPFESNLTSRRSRRHKHKRSSVTDVLVTEKRLSDMTGSSISLSNPSNVSRAQDPLIPDARTMPFFRSRAESSDNFSPHNPRSAAAASHAHLQGPDQTYQQPYPSRASQRYADGKAPFKGDTDFGLSSPTAYSPYDDHSPTSPYDAHSPTRPSRHDSLKNDNWFVHDEDAVGGSNERPRRFSFEESDYGSDHEDEDEAHERAMLRPEPLRMNPPTPSPKPESQQQQQRQKHDRHDSQQAGIGSAYSPHWRRQQPPQLHQPQPQQRFSMPPMPTFQSAIGSISGRSDASNDDHYGGSGGGIGRALTTTSRLTDWTEMMVGGLRVPSPSEYHVLPSHKERNNSYSSSSSHGTSSGGKSSGRGNRFYGDLMAAPAPGGVRQQRSAERVGFRVDRSPRVVSRTGVDYLDSGDGGEQWDGGAHGHGHGEGRGRVVSGRAAEEGRAGAGAGAASWGTGLTQRKVSGMA
ncbi:uncharacterized protein K452DRAFT_117980 [Aplosporella prunicola CBS 121167]|uniref:Uncharacterized protein n=1 Tax=Aplosporella prunicola CBS 121167 TaxID=1176127 RepID=A0A6A6AXU6_9PEZI|nr:uncharacterized protein K452DRAFT_117980 [Aplosporella prunicola CBS 121167]KAF2136772.1 hypothetical protein K452DRAFT_117980 [Aplosporella prunicola CBS 121167]